MRLSAFDVELDDGMIGQGNDIGSFARDGYFVFRRVLSETQLAALRTESDRLRQYGERFKETIRDGQVRWLIQPGVGERPVLRGLQYPYRINAPFDEVRTARAMFDILEPFIGPNIVSVLGTLFWKPAGASETVIAYHQDASFRKPPEKYRNLESPYVQVGIALDPHGPDNGGMRFVVGSHRSGDMDLRRSSSVLSEAPSADNLAELGFGSSDVRDVAMAPGDVVIWHPYTLHGSPANNSRLNDRLFYVLGYMKQEDTEGGEPSFLAGQPCSLFNASF
jgi:ectoine hydroxylase-related dioxygenase (phytanoyl-CoA dioxygenase family)